MAEETPMKATQVKLVLLGEAAVGKSSLVMRFVSNDFNENNSPTIGAAFLTQKCRLENRIVKFEIWDTAGQERFHSLAPMYYRNAAAAVVVYDITKAASLEKAKAWVKELQRQANPNIVIALVGNKLDLVESDTSASSVAEETELATVTRPETTPDDHAPAVTEEADAEIVADADADAASDDGSVVPPPAVKASTSDNARQVPFAEAQSYAKESGLLFFEASAKTGLNVGEVFTEIAKTIPLDPVGAKTPAAAGAGRRSAGGAGNAGEPGKVALGEGQGAKKGGCC